MLVANVEREACLRTCDGGEGKGPKGCVTRQVTASSTYRWAYSAPKMQAQAQAQLSAQLNPGVFFLNPYSSLRTSDHVTSQPTLHASPPLSFFTLDRFLPHNQVSPFVALQTSWLKLRGLPKHRRTTPQRSAPTEKQKPVLPRRGAHVVQSLASLDHGLC